MLFPNGHHKFIPFVVDNIRLHNDKNRDYAFGGNPLGNFERVSNILSLYPGLNPGDKRTVAITYMLKQLDAYLWMLSQGHESVTNEGRKPRIKDVNVYSGILHCMEEDNA